ncbi:MAG: hypothetical protein NWQ54_16680, partial [Paraglaciecola sp.]|nr:hypothetical protein [Paraglaciecola sp.]
MIALTLTHANTKLLCNNVVQFAVPFASGERLSIAGWCVLRNQQPLPTDTQITAYWPDGSVRWVLVT